MGCRSPSEALSRPLGADTVDRQANKQIVNLPATCPNRFLCFCFSLYPRIAFIDTQKPVKDKLNPEIIADIVQLVTRRCHVNDTAVRSAITTKCADENKMLRQRTERERKALAAEEAANKENEGAPANR